MTAEDVPEHWYASNHDHHNANHPSHVFQHNHIGNGESRTGIDTKSALDYYASSSGFQYENDEYVSSGASASPPVESLHDRLPRSTKRSSDAP